MAGEDVDSRLVSKLYLFCDQVSGHDAFVAREFLGQFEVPEAFFHRCVISTSLPYLPQLHDAVC